MGNWTDAVFYFFCQQARPRGSVGSRFAPHAGGLGHHRGPHRDHRPRPRAVRAVFQAHQRAQRGARAREIRRRHFIRGEFLFLFVLLLFAHTDVLFNTARRRLPKRAVSAD